MSATILNAIELRKDRAKLIAEAGKIVSKAYDEKRGVSQKEKDEWEKLHADAEGLKRAIDMIDGQNDADRKLAASLLDSRGGSVSATETATDTGDGPVLSRGESAATRLRSLGVTDEYNGLSLGGYVRSIVLGPRTDVEKRALSEGTDSAGGFTVPVQLLGETIDRLRAASTVFKAGARTVLLNTDKTSIARLATDPTATWKTENAQLSDNSPTLERLQFDAQTLMSIVLLSRELLEDSVNVETMLRNAFAGAFAVKLDLAALLGSGTPPEPAGIFGTSGIGSVSMGTNGATLAASGGYDKLLDTRQALLDANAGEPTAWIMAPRTQIQLSKLKDTTNQYIAKPAGLDAPFYATTQIPVTQTQGTSGAVASSIITGNFAECFIGIRTSMRIEVLKERYADYLQYGLLCYMRADVQLAHPASFAKLIGIL